MRSLGIHCQGNRRLPVHVTGHPQDSRHRGSLLALCFLLCTGSIAPAQDAPAWAVPFGRPSTRVRVLVRGDDFGGTHASNRALEPAFAAGIMKSASVMAVGPWFAETAALARAHPEWTIGLHLALTSEGDNLRWGPVLVASSVPTLIAPDGYFFRDFHLTKQDLLQDLQRLPAELRSRHEPLFTDQLPLPDEVEAELRAQIGLARQNGLRIDYLDCHMWIACLPGLRRVLIKLAAELCVPIPEAGWMGTREIMMPPIAEDSAATIRNLRDVLIQLRPGLYRIVLHPAVESEELRSVDTFWANAEARRQQSTLAALTSREIQKLVAERAIETLSVRDLWDYERCRLRDLDRR